MEALDISALYHAALEETDGTGHLDGRVCMRLTTTSRLGMSWKPCECRSDIAQPAVRQLELQVQYPYASSKHSEHSVSTGIGAAQGKHCPLWRSYYDCVG